MLETLDYTIRIGSTPTFFHFDLCLYSALRSTEVVGLGWSEKKTLFKNSLFHNKRSVLRRQSRDTNPGPSSEGANARNVRLYYPYWQYTDLFIFRFVSQ